MENLAELKHRVIEYLSGLTAFESAAVVEAYPEKQRAFPLKSPVIAVELGGTELVSAGLGGYLGGEAMLYGSAALITLRFGIYHTEAAGCGILFESICSALFDAEWLGVQKINCGESAYDAKTAAYLLPAAAVFKLAWVVPKQEERLFENIQIICEDVII